MNSIVVYGRFTANPEMKTAQDGKQYAVFTVADNRGDKASFFNCIAFGKTAENIVKCQKGHRIVVAGRMEQNEWTDQQGQNHQRWTLIVDEMNYVEPAPQQAQQQAPAPYGQPPANGQYGPPAGYPQYGPPPAQGQYQQWGPAPVPQPQRQAPPGPQHGPAPAGNWQPHQPAGYPQGQYLPPEELPF